MPQAAEAAAARRITELGAAANRLLARMDDRSIIILKSRILAIRNKTTLQELATRFGLTRERIRQIEDKILRKIRFRIGQKENHSFCDAARQLRDQLGLVASPEQVDSIEHIFNESKVSQESPVLFSLLFWEAGPYERYEGFFVLAPAQKVVSSTTKILRALTRKGPAESSAVRGELTKARINQNVQELWVSHVSPFRFWRGLVVRWDGNVGDKAALILAMRKCPMTVEEISAEMAEVRSARTLANRLLADRRFCRTDPNRFALKSWGLKEYSSIAEELIEEINQRGGEAAPQDLVRALTAKFGVSALSVKSYIASPRFVRTGRGTIRLRNADEGFSFEKSIELTRRCYRTGRGWSYRLTVDEELLRGSGRPLPGAFGVLLGVKPLRALDLRSQNGTVRVSWPIQQPTIGSLRLVAEKLRAEIGDYLFIEFRPKRKLNFFIVRNADVHHATGLRRLHIEMGALSAMDDDAAVQRIGYALGFDSSEASIAAIRRRLQARGEDDLLPLLPQENESDNKAALDELIGLVGG